MNEERLENKINTTEEINETILKEIVKKAHKEERFLTIEVKKLDTVDHVAYHAYSIEYTLSKKENHMGRYLAEGDLWFGKFATIDRIKKLD